MKYDQPEVTSVRVQDVLSQLGPARAQKYDDDEKSDFKHPWKPKKH